MKVHQFHKIFNSWLLKPVMFTIRKVKYMNDNIEAVVRRCSVILVYNVTRSSHRRCSVKKMFLEISQNWQENTCVRVSFLIKLQAFFCRTPLVATFIPCWTVTTEIKELWNLKLHTLAGMLKALFILGIYFRAPRKVISFQGNHFHGYALKP